MVDNTDEKKDQKIKIVGIWQRSTKKYVLVETTQQKPSQRMTHHRTKARKGNPTPIHQLMATQLDDFEMHTLEEVDESKAEDRLEHHKEQHQPSATNTRPALPVLLCECGAFIIGAAALKRHRASGPHTRAMALLHPPPVPEQIE